MRTFKEIQQEIYNTKNIESLQNPTILYETKMRLAHLCTLFDNELIDGVIEFGQFIEKLKQLQQEGEAIHFECLEEASSV
jgi:hypothetical protein